MTVARLLARVCNSLEASPWVAVGVLAAVYLLAVVGVSHAKPLWHDELFTFYIAQAPTLRAMWSDLSSLDLNPPLVYLVTRLSYACFGVSTFSTRLPEMVFYLCAIVAMYRFVSVRLGSVFGLFAAALMLLGKSFDLAVEARPYTLMLGCLAVALVGWQEATSPDARHRRAGLVLLPLAVVGALLSHIFAVPAVGVIVLAEAWRSRSRRQVDWTVLLALMLPFAVVVTYVPMLRTHGAGIYPPSFVPSGETIFDFYLGAIERELVVLLLTGLAVLITLGPGHLRGGDARPSTTWFFLPREWVVMVGLMSLPLLLIVRLMLSQGAFFSRYGAAASLAVVVLTTALLARWTSAESGPDPRAAALGLAIALLISGLPVEAAEQLYTGAILHTMAEPAAHPCEVCQRTTAAGGASLPLVDASGITFLEMNHVESPALLDRLYYLTDPQASTSYAHANIFERMDEEVERFHLRGHTMRYSEFVRTHRHFYVVGRYDWPEDWVLRKLLDDGANLRVLGRTSDVYRDKELYEVELPDGFATSAARTQTAR